MLAVARFSVPETEAAGFLAAARTAIDSLAAQPGYRSGSVGRTTDDPTRWVLVTTWGGVGAYRRALSAYDVRVSAVPLLSRAVDEPGAYETLYAQAEGQVTSAPSRRAADADVVGLGDAAAPEVRSDLE